MREAKYRAWHKLTSEMFEVHGISPTAVEERKNGISYAYDRKEVVLMQYTGLKDKNGAEIYEGDIVECLIDFGIGDAEIRMEVKFGGFGINIQHWTFEHEWSKPVVIGNVFRNPELLKGEQKCER